MVTQLSSRNTVNQPTSVHPLKKEQKQMQTASAISSTMPSCDITLKVETWAWKTIGFDLKKTQKTKELNQKLKNTMIKMG